MGAKLPIDRRMLGTTFAPPDVPAALADLDEGRRPEMSAWSGCALLTAAAVALTVPPAFARQTPAQMCLVGKSKTAGAYAACRMNAEAKLAATGNPRAYNAALEKCEATFLGTWQKLERKATATGTTCLDGSVTERAFRSVIDADTRRLAVALTGGGLAVCGDGTAEASEPCDAFDLGGRTCVSEGFVLGTLRCTPGCALDTSGCFATRFTDNGDGTVTDHLTELQWEKKVSPGNGEMDPHDVDNVYTWGDLDGCPFRGCANGSAFSDFLLRLNGCIMRDRTSVSSAGFAGHCDWRLPTLQELRTIVDIWVPGCAAGSPCIDPIFGPTALNTYWSATMTDYITPGTTNATEAWVVYFYNGLDSGDGKLAPNSARAVRNGP